MFALIAGLFFLIPVAVTIFMIVSICCYLSAKEKHRLQPDSANEGKKHFWKWMIIVSAAMEVVLLLVVIGFAVLFLQAVAYM